MKNQSLRIAPKTVSGIWSDGLIVAMALLFVMGTSFANTIYESVPSGNNLLADIAARPALALSMLAGMAAGIAAFITGLLAIVKKKDNALLVYASTVIGALLILILIGNIMFPD